MISLNRSSLPPTATPAKFCAIRAGWTDFGITTCRGLVGDSARNGEIVVALVNREEVTLKRIEQTPQEVILHPANVSMLPVAYPHEAVQIQGVLRGLLRRYP